jgi:hypothetical protein
MPRLRIDIRKVNELLLEAKQVLTEKTYSVGKKKDSLWKLDPEGKIGKWRTMGNSDMRIFLPSDGSAPYGLPGVKGGGRARLKKRGKAPEASKQSKELSKKRGFVKRVLDAFKRKTSKSHTPGLD